MANKKKPQKMFYYSSEEYKSLIESLVEEKSRIMDISESRIIEEYIISGILRDFPCYQGEHLSIFLQLKENIENRYRLLDKKFLDDN